MSEYTYVTPSNGGIFKFKNSGCICKIDKVHDVNGEPIYEFKVKGLPDKEFIYHHYFKKGTVKVSDNFKTEYNPISDLPKSPELSEFIYWCESYNINKESIPVSSNDKVSFEEYLKSIPNFFEKYGCLVPIPEEFVSLNAYQVNRLFERLYILINLISAVNEGIKNYTKIFYYTMFLALHCQVELNCNKSNGDCIHSISSADQGFAENYWLTNLNYEKVKPISSIDLVDYPDAVIHGNVICTPDYESNDGYASNKDHYLYYPVVDYFVNNGEGHVFLRKSAYLGYLDDEDRSESFTHKFINYLYVHSDAQSRNNKLLIDFLFHFHSEIMEITDISDYIYEAIQLKEDIDLNRCPYFNKKYRDTLIELAKIVIKKELDHVVSVIHPIYNEEEMMPGWHIPDLFTALYYGIFLQDSAQTIFRACANPTCNNMFTVDSTNYKKRYCSETCRSCAAQRLYRKRHSQV